MDVSFLRKQWFDRPFDGLTVLSEVEGLTTLSIAEGESKSFGVSLDSGFLLCCG